MFGRIEKELRRKENILSPSEKPTLVCRMCIQLNQTLLHHCSKRVKDTKAFVNKVKKEKKADVKKLMAFFVVPEDCVEFYASIMDVEEVIADDEVDIFDENETFH